MGSLATDPICKAHQLYRSQQTLKPLYKNSSDIKIAQIRAAMLGGIGFYGIVGMPLGIFGIACRKIASMLLERPFIHIRGNAPEKTLLDKKFSMLSWNICAVGGGYTISDGGVLPWPQRIDTIANEILKHDTDIVCLQETIDAGSWVALVERLRQRYAHFYVNMGNGSLVHSGLFVASKAPVSNPEFTAFPLSMLYGRSKQSGKGFFSFDLEGASKPIASIVLSHLGHSEAPEFPEEGEVEARRLQMEMIAQKVEQIAKDRAIVVTGDLNMDDLELSQISSRDLFTKGNIKSDTQKTWGGDEFCALLVGDKKVSGPLNLDHTLLLEGTAKSIATRYFPTGFDPKVYQSSASSDHEAGLSEIILNS